MAVGPVQLVVLGFSNPEFHGEIVAELQKLRESDTVRVIDALAVYKDGEGNVEVKKFSNLSDDERGELGSKVGALLGLGVGGIEGAEIGAEAGAQASASGAGFFNEDEAWDAVGQLMFLHAYPFWSLALFAVCMLIIYALTVYGGVRPDLE